jgi:hypothetical protein
VCVKLKGGVFKVNILKKMVLLGCVSLSVAIMSNKAASILPERKTIDFLNQIGGDCPDLEMLRPLMPETNNVNLVPSLEQGGNSIVYFGQAGGIPSIVKISKKVEANSENSETQKTIRAIDRINGLNDPVFKFAIPTKLYVLMSPDGQRECDVQIAPKVDGQKINSYFYQYVSGRLKATDLFEKLGQKLGQFQQKNIVHRNVDGFDYGPLHNDFQVGNIFYNQNDDNFTLIDLSDFASKGKLILDPIYFVYFLPHLWGAPGKSNEQHFRDRYNNGQDNFKERIDSIVASFLRGYVNNLSEAMASKMYIYFKNNNTPGVSAFGFNAKKMGIYGQDLQNINSQDILEPLIKKYFLMAYEQKYNNVPVSFG